jgi:epoxyqueuosine reductase
MGRPKSGVSMSVRTSTTDPQAASPDVDPPRLTQRLKAEAGRLGFALAGVCPAVSPPGYQRFRDWLAAGYAGQMRYLDERREAYSSPGHLLDGARSVVMLAMNYGTTDPPAVPAGHGRVSCYAWGNDYHDIVHDRLHQLADWFRQQLPDAAVRGVVDTAPLLEREFAELAGLGWIGKNTLVIHRGIGSWFFLAALITDQTLDYDRERETDHCGTCRACLDACPTDAFVAPYVLDARRCISYLTIELREAIPRELRPLVGDWLFGCDVCQEVCPWNSKAPTTLEPTFAPPGDSSAGRLELAALFELDEAAFRARFRHTPLWRAKRRGLLRNAAIVLGNNPSSAGLAALARGLDDDEPLVRGASAWALGHYPRADALPVLERRLNLEQDLEVREEISVGLEQFGRS